MPKEDNLKLLLDMDDLGLLGEANQPIGIYVLSRYR